MRGTKQMLLGVLFLFSVTAVAVASTHPTVIQHPVRFADYKGKWIVLNYWASWCGYCQEEIPELNAFYQSHRQQVVMFGVDYEDAPARGLSERIQASGIAFPVLAYDPERYFRFRMGQITGLPTTLLIGPDGQLKRVLQGPQTKRSLEHALGL